jgi:hypothetical protein
LKTLQTTTHLVLESALLLKSGESQNKNWYFIFCLVPNYKFLSHRKIILIFLQNKGMVVDVLVTFMGKI